MTIKSVLRKIPLLTALKNSHSGKRLQYWVRLQFGSRKNYTYTRFLRFPTQYRTLCGPVMSFLGFPANRTLRIAVIGCSNGAEAYSIASCLRSAFPDTSIEINAVDILPDILETARAAIYPRDKLPTDSPVHTDFIRNTFEPLVNQDDEFLTVKSELRALVTFRFGDALDPEMPRSLGAHDIVFAQNFLYHLDRSIAEIAFNNICALLAPRSALFIDGIDLDLRERLTAQNSLQPLKDLLEEIHEEAREERGSSWPAVYWGLEPLTKKGDWARRYATIFLRGGEFRKE
jgi:chemotaxis protein methyltransferase CheR